MLPSDVNCQHAGNASLSVFTLLLLRLTTAATVPPYSVIGPIKVDYMKLLSPVLALAQLLIRLMSNVTSTSPQAPGYFYLNLVIYANGRPVRNLQCTNTSRNASRLSDCESIMWSLYVSSRTAVHTYNLVHSLSQSSSLITCLVKASPAMVYFL